MGGLKQYRTLKNRFLFETAKKIQKISKIFV